MKCKKIQELLKSDYLDGELSEVLHRRVEEHLDSCQVCQNLKKELLSERQLFKAAKQYEIPQAIWQNILKKITQEQLQKEAKLSRVWERLREVLLVRRPKLAFATAVTILLLIFAGIMFKASQIARELYIQTVVSDYRINGNIDELLYDLETGIEEYFL